MVMQFNSIVERVHSTSSSFSWVLTTQNLGSQTFLYQKTIWKKAKLYIWGYVLDLLDDTVCALHLLGVKRQRRLGRHSNRKQTVESVEYYSDCQAKDLTKDKLM